MKKELKDYLHFYLGCDLKTETGIIKLIAVQKEVIPCTDYRVICLNGNVTHELKGDFKPLLRPLSSITEEEAIESAKLTEYEPHFNDVKVTRNAYNDLIVTWQGSNESRELLNVTGEYFYCPEQFQYLLKKRFDLFHLIEDDLAIANPLS